MLYDTERFADGCAVLGKVLAAVLILWGAYCLLVHEGIADAWIQRCCPPVQSGTSPSVRPVDTDPKEISHD